MGELGKLVMMLGFFLFLLGLILTFWDKIPFNLGRLPGDIVYEKENFSFYFPITTSIILSIVLSLLISLFNRFFGS